MNTPTAHETANASPEEQTVSNLMRSTNPAVSSRLVAHRVGLPWEKLAAFQNHWTAAFHTAERLLAPDQQAAVFEAYEQACDAFARCGSPIEELFLAAFVLNNDDFCWRVQEGSSLVGFCHRSGVVLQQQARVGAFRVDFIVAGQRTAVVELDGHDFHERTKEQAERDKRRDRELQATGLAVLRFTGSEVWRDPMVAANQSHRFAVGGIR